MPKLSRAFLQCVAVSAIVISIPSARAQTASTPSPQTNPGSGQPLEFKVATIKLVDPKSPSIRTEADVDPSGTVKIYGLSLKGMIEVAFNVGYWQIAGGEAWMEKNLYNVVGQPPDAVRQSKPDTRHTVLSIENAQLREMLQALLIERFQLKIHHTTQTGKVYFLERTAKKLALLPVEPVSADTASPPNTGGSIEIFGRRGIYNTTMPQLASFASDAIVHRPVSDHTGLTGAFNFLATPADREDSNAYMTDPVGSFMNLLNDMGLKLESAQGQAEMLVIDGAELPSANEAAPRSYASQCRIGPDLYSMRSPCIQE